MTRLRWYSAAFSLTESY